MKSRYFAPFLIGALLACGSGSTSDSSGSGDDGSTIDSATAGDTNTTGTDTAGTDTTTAVDTGSTGSDTASPVDGSGDADPLGTYPPGPYGINVGDTIPNLAWQGYVNPTAAAVSTTMTFGPTSLQELRPTAKKGYALIHVAEFT